MDDLIKAVVMTRGRTGSSAITQELGLAPGCHSEQEVFSQAPGRNYYDFPPFEIWREGREGDEEVLADAYLAALEAHARDKGAKALFWKLLSSHCDQRPYLCEVVARRGYQVIYLRRSLARQVLSGMLAKHRGVYNTYDAVEAGAPCDIDLDEMRRLIAGEHFGLGHDEMLRHKYRMGLALEVTYEQYIEDREGFFARIYACLRLPAAVPKATQFQVMIQDLKSEISNYDEVAAVVAEEYGETL